jgi:hypothetical protein
VANLTTAASFPTAPQWDISNSTASSVFISWIPPPSNGDDVTRYVLQRALRNSRSISSLAAAPPANESPAQMRDRAKLHQALQHSTSLLVQMQAESGATYPLQFQDLIELPPYSLTFVDTMVSPANSYVYRLRAVNDFGSGLWTEKAVKTDSVPPDAPLEVAVAEVDFTVATISWKRPAANGPAIFQYRMDIALVQDPPLWTTVYEGNRLSARVSQLKRGTSYFVRILVSHFFYYVRFDSCLSLYFCTLLLFLGG